ncbi:uncharacterized protein LOC141904462 [Tubulanus polymorphus]|uniref:uncharacterized protein LOC141904462 n=1 Tax=Tubulanus polymorphus TaxID=672921 RepID=UPI003DA49228
MATTTYWWLLILFVAVLVTIAEAKRPKEKPRTALAFDKAEYLKVKRVFACAADTLAPTYGEAQSFNSAPIKTLRANVLAKWDALPPADKTTILNSIAAYVKDTTAIDLTTVPVASFVKIPALCLHQLPWTQTKITMDQFKEFVKVIATFKDKEILNGVIDALKPSSLGSAIMTAIEVAPLKAVAKNVMDQMMKRLAGVFGGDAAVYTAAAIGKLTCRQLLVTLQGSPFLGELVATQQRSAAQLTAVLDKIGATCGTETEIKNNVDAFKKAADLFAAVKMKTTLVTSATPFTQFVLFIPFFNARACTKLPTTITEADVAKLKTLNFDFNRPKSCSSRQQEDGGKKPPPRSRGMGQIGGCLKKVILKITKAKGNTALTVTNLKALGNMVKYIPLAKIDAVVFDSTYQCKDLCVPFGLTEEGIDIKVLKMVTKKCTFTAAEITALKATAANTVPAVVNTHGCTVGFQKPTVFRQVPKAVLCHQNLLKLLAATKYRDMSPIIAKCSAVTTLTATSTVASFTEDVKATLGLKPYTEIKLLPAAACTNLLKDPAILPQILMMDIATRMHIVTTRTATDKQANAVVAANEALIEVVPSNDVCANLDLATIKTMKSIVGGKKALVQCLLDKIPDIKALSEPDLKAVMKVIGPMFTVGLLDTLTLGKIELGNLFCSPDVFPYVTNNVRKKAFDNAKAAIMALDNDGDGAPDGIIDADAMAALGPCAIYTPIEDICNETVLPATTSYEVCKQIGQVEGVCRPYAFWAKYTTKCFDCLKSINNGTIAAEDIVTLGPNLAAELTDAQFKSTVLNTTAFDQTIETFGACKSWNKILETLLKKEMTAVKPSSWAAEDAPVKAAAYGNLMTLLPDLSKIPATALGNEKMCRGGQRGERRDDDSDDECEIPADKSRRQRMNGLLKKYKEVNISEMKKAAAALGTPAGKRRKRSTAKTYKCDEIRVLQTANQIATLTTAEINAIAVADMRNCYTVLCGANVGWKDRAILDRLFQARVFGDTVTMVANLTSNHIESIPSCIAKMNDAEIASLIVTDDNIVSAIGGTKDFDKATKQKLVAKMIKDCPMDFATATNVEVALITYIICEADVAEINKLKPGTVKSAITLLSNSANRDCSEDRMKAISKIAIHTDALKTPDLWHQTTYADMNILVAYLDVTNFNKIPDTTVKFITNEAMSLMDDTLMKGMSDKNIAALTKAQAMELRDDVLKELPEVRKAVICKKRFDDKASQDTCITSLKKTSAAVSITGSGFAVFAMLLLGFAVLK